METSTTSWNPVILPRAYNGRFLPMKLSLLPPAIYNESGSFELSLPLQKLPRIRLLI